MRIRKVVVALVAAGFLAGVGYVDIGSGSVGSEVACTVNNDDGIGGGGNRCGRGNGRKAGRKARKAGKVGKVRVSVKPFKATGARPA